MNSYGSNSCRALSDESATSCVWIVISGLIAVSRSLADASRDGRNDAHGVGGGHRCLLLLQIADIFVVHVDIDEAPQLPLLVVQVRLETAVPARQIGQQIADRGAVGVDRFFLIGVRPER